MAVLAPPPVSPFNDAPPRATLNCPVTLLGIDAATDKLATPGRCISLFVVGVCHVALPAASEVRTLPTPAPVERLKALVNKEAKGIPALPIETDELSALILTPAVTPLLPTTCPFVAVILPLVVLISLPKRVRPTISFIPPTAPTYKLPAIAILLVALTVVAAPVSTENDPGTTYGVVPGT